MDTIGLKLSDVEQRYFGDLFSCYDVENHGKIAGSKASELFLASQLPTEILHQITDLCGAKRLGHFGRSQFYIALKFIAAAQAGLPLNPDILCSGIEIPLPKFGRHTNEICTSISDTRPLGISAQLPGHLPPPPAKAHRTSLGSCQKQSSLKETENSPNHHPQTRTSVQPSTVVHGPAVASTDSISSSPVDIPASPRNSNDKGWTSFQNQDGLLSWTQFEEQHHLLGNEEDSSERHSSDEEFDIWSITDEQREYYTNQFKSMQPDLKGKITGATAKDFFEKSKLPLQELSKIWQLSDVDKDGALSLEEFCTAMHLVVLRRNNIDLPETLPPSLVPTVSQKANEDSLIIPAAQVQTTHAVMHQGATSPKQTSPGEVLSPQSKEWTKFNDSPTSSLSSPGMKPVNFDFSAASVEQDPRILHPVALRLSPDRQPESFSNSTEKQPAVVAEETSKTSTPQAQIVQRPVHRKALAPSLSAIPPPTQASIDTVIDAIGHSANSSFSGTSNTATSGNLASSSQGSLSLPQGPKKEPPPPPPPRPKPNHTRSSSLDLNRLGKTVPHFLGVPPAVPPRMSPSTATPKKANVHTGEEVQNEEAFADFSNFDDTDSSNLQLKSGAFEIYKKPFMSQSSSGNPNSSLGSTSFLIDQTSTPSATTDDSTALLVDISQPEETDRKRHLSAPPLALVATTITSVPRDKREVLSAIRAHRERNMMLLLMNNELNQELSEVMEERIALEIQLEHLKPFS